MKDKKMFEELISYLVSKGKKVYLSRHARDNLNGKFKELEDINYSKKFDLLIAFGWDGTILRAVRNLKYVKSTLLLGINAGHLWFLTTMGIKQWKKSIDKILSWEFREVHKQMCKIKLERNGKEILKTKFLNEAVISYRNVARIVNIDAKVGHRSLCRYSADWLIISTSTWSTAYNLSAWGPLIYPGLSALSLTPICPHSLTQKPIIIPSDKKIHLLFIDNTESMNLTVDWQRSFEIFNTDKITIEAKKTKLRFIHKKGEYYFKTLRKKMWWATNIR